MPVISVGIDVSKGKSTVCVLKSAGEVIAAPYEVDHTQDGLRKLTDYIQECKEEVRVILEATGHYHWPVVNYLLSHDIFVCCVNALRMKKYSAQSLHRAKTDRIDSVKIATYGIFYWNELEPMHPAEDVYRELRTYSRQYYQYLSLLVKAKINLGILLDQTMPGIQSVLTDQCGKRKLTDFVLRYWHYGNILQIGQKRFVNDCCKWMKKEGYRMNERQTTELYALAQSGIPTLPSIPSTKALIAEAVRVLQGLEESRDTILAHMDTLANTLPEYGVVRAMDGIGVTLAAGLIAEIGDVRRFHNSRALIAYAGIDAPPYQSGAFYGTQRSISKRGNRYLRKAGYEAMQVLARIKPADNPVYLFMLKKEQEGKPKKVAKIAAFNKFLRIYYARVSEVLNALAEETLV